MGLGRVGNLGMVVTVLSPTQVSDSSHHNHTLSTKGNFLSLVPTHPCHTVILSCPTPSYHIPILPLTTLSFIPYSILVYHSPTLSCWNWAEMTQGRNTHLIRPNRPTPKIRPKRTIAETTRIHFYQPIGVYLITIVVDILTGSGIVYMYIENVC